jgi:hypothetical protein
VSTVTGTVDMCQTAAIFVVQRNFLTENHPRTNIRSHDHK